MLLCAPERTLNERIRHVGKESTVQRPNALGTCNHQECLNDTQLLLGLVRRRFFFCLDHSLDAVRTGKSIVSVKSRVSQHNSVYVRIKRVYHRIGKDTCGTGMSENEFDAEERKPVLRTTEGASKRILKRR